MNKITAGFASLAALFALGACAVPGQSHDTSPVVPPSSDVVTSAPSDNSPVDPPSEDPTESESPEPSTYEAKLGDTFLWEDGMKAYVNAEVKSSSEEYDSVASDGKYVVVTVKVTNGSDARKNVDLGGNLNVSYGEDGKTAESAYVSDGDYDTYFSGNVSPGRSKTAQFAYAITAKQARDLTIEFGPSYDYDTAEFTGSAR